jgi:hypothetical protein
MATSDGGGDGRPIAADNRCVVAANNGRGVVGGDGSNVGHVGWLDEVCGKIQRIHRDDIKILLKELTCLPLRFKGFRKM